MCALKDKSEGRLCAGAPDRAPRIRGVAILRGQLPNRYASNA